jgi:hypothetical protein
MPAFAAQKPMCSILDLYLRINLDVSATWTGSCCAVCTGWGAAAPGAASCQWEHEAAGLR